MNENQTEIRLTSGTIIAAIGLLGVGAGSYMALSARVTAIETTAANAHVAEIPSRLATIEANQQQVLLLLRNTEDGNGRRGAKP